MLGRGGMCRRAELRPVLLLDLVAPVRRARPGPLPHGAYPSFIWLPAQPMAFGTWIPLHLSRLVKCKQSALQMRMRAWFFGLLGEIVIFHLTEDFHQKKWRKRKKNSRIREMFLFAEFLLNPQCPVGPSFHRHWILCWSLKYILMY